jgi:uncharacterized protein (DUF58 family)
LIVHTRSIGRLGDFLTGEYCVRFERYVRWLRNPLAILVLTMVAAILCGFFLHGQGFVVAFGLAGVITVGVAWPWLSLLGLSGVLSFERARVREGEPVKAHLLIRNRCPWGASGLSLHLGLDPVPRPAVFERVAAGIPHAGGFRKTEVAWDFVPACRGVLPEMPPGIGCGFPFGLWKARRALATNGTLVVWPRTFPVGPIPETPEGESALGLALRNKPGTWGDLLGVRPYRRGDPLRRIHWPQTARHGQLVVCEVQTGAVPRVQIVLDSHPCAHAGEGPDSSREWSIRVAASLAEGWIKQGAEVDFVTDRTTVSSSSAPAKVRAARVLDALARLAAGGERSLEELLRVAQSRMDDRGLCVVVTTDRGLRGLGAAPARSLMAPRYVVLHASAFGRDENDDQTALLPVAPYIWIDGPENVAAALRRAGKEATDGR